MTEVSLPKIRICLLGVFFAFFACGLLFANEDAVILKTTAGIVRYLPQGAKDWGVPREGLNLTQDCRIKTSENGRAHIAITKNSWIMLRPDAEIEVGPTDIAENVGRVNCKLNLCAGMSRIAAKDEAANDSTGIKTPTALVMAKDAVYYLDVKRLPREENSPDAEERVITELFVENGEVFYANTISGQYFVVGAGESSKSYSDGNITLLLNVAEDKQREWSAGWEEIVSAESYQEPPSSLGTIGADSMLRARNLEIRTIEDDGNDARQGDSESAAQNELFAKARDASVAAEEASLRAKKASSDAADMAGEIQARSDDLSSAETVMDDSYLAAVTAIISVNDNCVLAAESAGETASEITSAIEGSLEFSDEMLVLRRELLQILLDEIHCDMESLNSELNFLQIQFDGEENEDSLFNCFNSACDEARICACELDELKARLDEGAALALLEGNNAALEALKVLVELTEAAISRANFASDAANAAGETACGHVEEALDLLSRADQIVDSLAAVKNDADNLYAYANGLSQDAETLEANAQLIRNAVAASEDAKDAALAAYEALGEVEETMLEIDSKNSLINDSAEILDGAYEVVAQNLDNARGLYDEVVAKAGDAESAINDAICDIDAEENKTSGYVIVDISSLRSRIDGYQGQMDAISADLDLLREDVDDLSQKLEGAGPESFLSQLSQASEDASYWAGTATGLVDELVAAAEAVELNGDGAMIECLCVLIDLTIEAIDNAHAAAVSANDAVTNSDGLLTEAEDLILQADALTARLDTIKAELVLFNNTELADVIDAADVLKNNAGTIVSDEILADIIAFEERREQDIIARESANQILERAYLRNEIREILEENDLRQTDAYLERISDAQAGKVLKDVYGNRVRVEQYILRPSSDVVELLNVNLRAGSDLTTLAWATTFNQSLDSLPTGQIKNLNWNSYLHTKYSGGLPDHIDSPAQSDGIYPAAMSITLSHGGDFFAEAKTFGPRSNGEQSIISQALLTHNFNNDVAMPYAKQSHGVQPDGTYSITDNQRNSEIGGAGYNPKGFTFDMADGAGNKESIKVSFYVISDDGERSGSYSSLAINDLGDALRVNMPGSNKAIGSNNLEMGFTSNVFSCGAIDLIYVPTTRMGWKPDDNVPAY